jgi:hypothetical protein
MDFMVSVKFSLKLSAERRCGVFPEGATDSCSTNSQGERKEERREERREGHKEGA